MLSILQKFTVVHFQYKCAPYELYISLPYYLILILSLAQVWIHEGVSLAKEDYELCAKLEKIPELAWIPSSGYFGVTAATGGLSDDHDVLSFITHTLLPLEERKEEVRVYTMYTVYSVQWTFVYIRIVLLILRVVGAC